MKRRRQKHKFRFRRSNVMPVCYFRRKDALVVAAFNVNAATVLLATWTTGVGKNTLCRDSQNNLLFHSDSPMQSLYP
jgi:hypothetical protein